MPGEGEDRAGDLPRVPPHLRLADDRRQGEREGALAYMGHANISITLDRYGHLMPGNEAEAADLLDAYLTAEHERATEQVREADGHRTGPTGPYPRMSDTRRRSLA